MADTSIQDVPTYAITLVPWITPVGPANRIQMQDPTKKVVLLFHYVSREAIMPHEDHLTIYYQAEGKDEWIGLETTRDTQRNLASATAVGNGLYQLAVTLPAANDLGIGWHSVGYPLDDTRPVATALQSLGIPIRSSFITTVARLAGARLIPMFLHLLHKG